MLLSHDQGLTLLDAETGKTLKETKKPGFLRLSNAGDGRHVMVSDADVFRVFDMGISSQPHGDHKHNYTYEPGLAERTFAAPKAGHVVPHAGKVSLFSDGAGTIQTLDADQVGSKTVEPHTAKTKAPHHGVAIALPDGTMVHTEGTKDARGASSRRRTAGRSPAPTTARASTARRHRTPRATTSPCSAARAAPSSTATATSTR